MWTVCARGGRPIRIGEGWNIRWSPQSDALYFLAGPRGSTALSKILIDPQAGTPRGSAIRVLSLPTSEYFDLSGSGKLVYEQTNTSAQARALVFGKAEPRIIEEDRFLTEG